VNNIVLNVTLIIQIITFCIIALLIYGIINIFSFTRRKQKQDKEILAKLNRIIDLMENNNKGS